MNVSLTPELARLVTEKVKDGMYSSASEVVRAALRLLVEQDQIRELRKEQLRKQIERGVADLDSGGAEAFDDELVAEIKRTGRATRGARRYCLASRWSFRVRPKPTCSRSGCTLQTTVLRTPIAKSTSCTPEAQCSATTRSLVVNEKNQPTFLAGGEPR